MFCVFADKSAIERRKKKLLFSISILSQFEEQLPQLLQKFAVVTWVCQATFSEAWKREGQAAEHQVQVEMQEKIKQRSIKFM